MINKKILKSIAVDLTPLLPSGENGGAKLFTLELIQQLAALSPHLSFVLLTNEDTNEELKILDNHNVKRHLIKGNRIKLHIKKIFFISFFRKILSFLPLRIKKLLHMLINYTKAVLLKNIRFLLNKLKRNHSQYILSKKNIDLLFCPFTAPFYNERGIPTVSVLYDLQYKIFPEFFTSSELTTRESTFRKACQLATKLVAISDYTKNTAIQYSELSTDKIRTIYIRMAKYPAIKTNSNPIILERLGLTKQTYLLYPANYWKHKNHEMLFTAFAIAIQNGLPENIQLVCTGSSVDRQTWLKKAVHQMGLEERVHFPGYLNYDELTALMAHASGLIYPSLYEGFGMPLIEAMINRTPVACSNCTSLSEIAGDAAILFNPRIPTDIARAILELIQDKTKTTRIVEAGLQRAMAFTAKDQMAKEYLEVFQNAYETYHATSTL